MGTNRLLDSINIILYSVTARKLANSVSQGYLRRSQRKYIISVRDKLADVNTISFICRGVLHTKLMVVTTALVALMNISPNPDCTANENRS
jgi:hypothetical protein